MPLRHYWNGRTQMIALVVVLIVGFFLFMGALGLIAVASAGSDAKWVERNRGRVLAETFNGQNAVTYTSYSFGKTLCADEMLREAPGRGYTLGSQVEQGGAVTMTFTRA